jgi:hypothetical protein
VGTVVISGVFILGGVLLGALLTHFLSQRGEITRLAAEDSRRWLNERRGIYSRYLVLCEDMLREIDGVACFLSYDGSEPISHKGEEEIREGLVEFLVKWHDNLQPLLSDVQLIATPEVSDLAKRTSFALMAASDPVERREVYVEYTTIGFQARDLLQVLRNQMRTELGLTPIREGPVSEPDWPWLPDRPTREA